MVRKMISSSGAACGMTMDVDPTMIDGMPAMIEYLVQHADTITKQEGETTITREHMREPIRSIGLELY
jgi:hypothetical protein